MFDIVSICETWCEHDPENEMLNNCLENFTCYSENATRISKHGRASGGICVFIRNKFDKFVSRIDKGFKFAVILELKNLSKSLGANDQFNNILLVCTYLPPHGSSAYGDEKNGVFILKEKLIDLKSRYPNHILLLAGDLNARIGTLYDYLPNDNVDHIPGFEWYDPSTFNIPRNSKDNIVNEFGDCLSAMCI